MKLKKYQKKILKKMGLKQDYKTYDNLSPKQINRYNWFRQKMKGKKKYDYMEITEPGSFKRPIHKYKNLMEWDKRNFDFQEKWRKKDHKKMRQNNPELPKYEKARYTDLYMRGDWFRLLEKQTYGKRKLVYGSLESANSYVFSAILDRLEEEVSKEIPILIVQKNRERDKKTGLIRVEIETRTGGRDKELAELNKRREEAQEDIFEDVLEELKGMENWTFKKEEEPDRKDELNYHYIIGGIEAAREISFRNFLKEFEKREQPIGILDNIIEKLFKEYRKKIFDDGRDA